jgi:hypothetical protein
VPIETIISCFALVEGIHKAVYVIIIRPAFEHLILLVFVSSCNSIVNKITEFAIGSLQNLQSSAF